MTSPAVIPSASGSGRTAVLDTPLSGADMTGREAILRREAIAAERMYRAECALHEAHQAHVDAWIAAACDRLHAAIDEHTAALAELRSNAVN